jgi:chorismate mutase
MSCRIPFTLLLLLPLSMACLARPPAPAASIGFDALADLSARRVQLADAVAASKRASGKPVEDLVREAEQLSSLVDRAGRLGLDADTARGFFRAQIEANKLVQYRLLAVGTDSAGTQAAPDLQAIRNELDTINAGMLRLLPQASSVPRGAECRTRLAAAIERTTAQRHLDDLHATALVRAFGDLCRRR